MFNRKRIDALKKELRALQDVVEGSRSGPFGRYGGLGADLVRLEHRLTSTERHLHDRLQEVQVNIFPEEARKVLAAELRYMASDMTDKQVLAEMAQRRRKRVV